MKKFMVLAATGVVAAGLAIGLKDTHSDVVSAATKKATPKTVKLTIKYVDTKHKNKVVGKSYTVTVKTNQKVSPKLKALTGYNLVKPTAKKYAKNQTLTVKANPKQYTITLKYVNKADKKTVKLNAKPKKYYYNDVIAQPKVSGYTSLAKSWTVNVTKTTTHIFEYKKIIPSTGTLYPGATKNYTRMSGTVVLNNGKTAAYVGYAKTDDGKWVYLLANNTYFVSAKNPATASNPDQTYTGAVLSFETFKDVDTVDSVVLSVGDGSRYEYESYLELQQPLTVANFNSLRNKYHVNDAKATFANAQKFLSALKINGIYKTEFMRAVGTVTVNSTQYAYIGYVQNVDGTYTYLTTNGKFSFNSDQAKCYH